MSVIEPYYDPYDPSTVYGQAVKQWSVDGKVGQTFADVLTYTSIRQAEAIETMAGGVRAYVEMRQERVDDLGEALTILAEALGSMSSEQDPKERWSSIEEYKLLRFNDIMSKYGEQHMELQYWREGKGYWGQVNYANASPKQAEVRTWLDADSTALNQCIVQMQSLIAKRNNAFDVAGKVMEKYNATVRQTIGAFGS